MPRRDLRAYLADIQAAIGAIEESTAGLELEDYRSDRRTRSAVEREFLIIGEAIRQMIDSDSSLAERISSARDIIAFRNQLAHGYFLISDATVWGIVRQRLPLLQREIEVLCREFGSSVM